MNLSTHKMIGSRGCWPMVTFMDAVRVADFGMDIRVPGPGSGVRVELSRVIALRRDIGWCIL